MTQPTPKHREEAGEIVERIKRWSKHAPVSDEKIVEMIAAALSARDREIREVLEGLRSGGCWCVRRPLHDKEPHEHKCLAARALYEKVQSVKEGNDG